MREEQEAARLAYREKEAVEQQERASQVQAAFDKAFVFPEPAAVTAKLAALDSWEATNKRKDILDALRDQPTGFPDRHQQKLRAVLQAQHPAWTSTLAKLQAAVLQPGGSIIGLLGPRGTGKTQLATALARYVAEQTVLTYGDGWERRDGPVHYTTLAGLLAEVRGTFKDDSRETEAGIMKALLRYRLLVLDEVHEGSGSDWASGLFTTLMDRRYGLMLDTILISNETPDAFTKNIGASVADRMRETGGVILCDWPSFRGAT